eukprot:3931638-Rhodomonas_salina.1
MEDVQKWEVEIKAEFCSLSKEAQRKVIKQVTGKALEAFENTDRWLGGSFEGHGIVESSQHLESLVRDLSSRKLLPALCFHMNRKGCKDLAQGLTRTLLRKEERTRRDENWKEKVQDVRRELVAVRDRILALASRNSDAIEPGMIRAYTELRAKRSLLLGPDPRFVLVPSGCAPIQESEILDALQLDAAWQVDAIYPNLVWLFNAMKRGIGMHHS